MKKSISEFIYGRNNKASMLLAMLIVSLIVLGCSGSKPEMPPETESQTLVKNSMSDFADAIEKEDFTAFREKVSKELNSQFSNDQMKTTFKSFIDKKDDVVPILREASKMNATFSPAPTIREEKGYYILVTGGTFATTPVATRFTNEYIWQDGKWKLLKIQVYL
jgi:hypothetical protein